MRNICCYWFALLSLCLRVSAQVGSEPMTLVAGQSVEREIAGGQTHAYQIPLTAGQFIRIVVEQKGVEVRLALTTPDGQQIVEVDQLFRLGGLGASSYEVAVSGNHQIVVRLPSVSPKGTYRLEIREKATATDQDKQQIAAERLLAEAIKLNQQRTPAFQQTLEKAQQALALWRALPYRYGEAYTLHLIGNAYFNSRQWNQAIEFFNQALVIHREVKDRAGEGYTLRGLAMAYTNAKQDTKAIECFEQVLVSSLETQNAVLEIFAAKVLSEHFYQATQYTKSLSFAERVLSAARRVTSRKDECDALVLLGKNNMRLGRYDEATGFFQAAIKGYRDRKDRLAEGGTLRFLGWNYEISGDFDKAIESHEQVLSIGRELKNLSLQREGLRSLAADYSRKGLYEKELDYFQQSLQVDPATNRAIASDIAWGMGNVYQRLKRFDEAIIEHEKARQLFHNQKRIYLEAELTLALMLDWKLKGIPGAAIFYGKQTINTYQSIRGNISGLGNDSQQSFVKSKEDAYRMLADLLISQGRLPEAEQVIRMLKEEEYFEYIRRDEANAPKAEKAALTPEEAAIEKRYREIADKLTDIGTERSALLDKKSRTPAEEQRLAKLEADLVVAGQSFQKFLDGLAAEMSKNADTNARAFQLRESQGLMEDLRELGKGTVALYTLVGEDKYRVILTTADFQKGYEYPIKAEELNRKVLAFRDVLQNPKLDPLPLAQELYKILVGPVAKDLKGTKAQMVMWSLDGVLRYLPVAALHDGKQYLVERYRTAVFTPASQSRLRVEPSRKWTALGLGVTKSHGLTIPALPGVLEEMHGIIQEAGTKTGVLPGSIKLDEAFTQEAMLTELRKRNPIVHIASHFRFQPGNETNSALLLGDGQFLSLAQIKALPNVFAGVDLLTLSACNTATGGAANGKEVEGFGVLAQRQGAKAVVARLWPVADRSTKHLMQEFYRLREAKAEVTKVEALRQAQIKLLRGELQVTGETLAAREIIHEPAQATNQPAFKPDPKAPYAHPYYWAPFILIGNWK